MVCFLTWIKCGDDVPVQTSIDEDTDTEENDITFVGVIAMNFHGLEDTAVYKNIGGSILDLRRTR